MSQYSSRIHIQVSSPEVWSRCAGYDGTGFDLAKLARSDQTAFVTDELGAVNESKLERLVENLAQALEADGIIIADTTNINVDTYEYCVFYLGGRVRTKEFSLDRNAKKSDMFFETDIQNIEEWLSYGEFSVSQKERSVLFRFDIVQTGSHFVEISRDIQMPDWMYLRETSFANRAAAIEKISVGEKVRFVHAEDLYDPFRLEAVSQYGSLGYLPSEASDELAPLLLSHHLIYTATVQEVVPVSKRNKHAKSSLVKISIEASVSDQEIPETSP